MSTHQFETTVPLQSHKAQKEKQEASRRTIEAKGIRDANKIISEGLTPQIIQYKTIEAYRELSKSPNAKLIIGSGAQPILMEP